MTAARGILRAALLPAVLLAVAATHQTFAIAIVALAILGVFYAATKWMLDDAVDAMSDAVDASREMRAMVDRLADRTTERARTMDTLTVTISVLILDAVERLAEYDEEAAARIAHDSQRAFNAWREEGERWATTSR